MNNVSLMGRLTADVELRIPKGKDATPVSTFTIAVDNPYKEDSADFIRIKCFGKTAEFAEKHFSKGVRVGLVGRIQTGSYEHKDGYTVYTTDVVASNFFFADVKKEETPKETPKKGYSRR